MNKADGETTWESKLPKEPWDGPTRWMIPSRTKSEESYLVDLAANKGIGECQCPHFIARCNPSIRKGIPKRCFHIVKARELFTDWIIPRLAKLDTNKE